MTRAIIATYMTRYPMGGNLSWAVQYALGLKRAGCDVTIVERANYPDACYDPETSSVSDDPGAGLKIVRPVLEKHGLEDCYTFIDYHDGHHGLSAAALRERLRTADCFIDSGNHGAFYKEAEHIPVRVLIDGEPGFTQIRYQLDPDRAESADFYTHHYSNGLLLGTDLSRTPPTGHHWRPLPNVVNADLFADVPPAPEGAAWTTIMNWKAHQPLRYEGKVYGQKDLSFELFERLPTLTDQPLEVAVSGSAPRERLRGLGWSIARAQAVTQTVDDYYSYIRGSLGEFSVAKHVFVEARTGWFSDRSAAYLASGRPVVLQDTGFSEVLPTGEGLFAVDTPEDAAAAIDAVMTDPARHAAAARAIAREYLDAGKHFRRLLSECFASEPVVSSVDRAER